MTTPLTGQTPIWLLASAACAVIATLSAPATTAAAPAAPAEQLEFLPASKIWLTGNSNIHPFQSTAKQWRISAPVTSYVAGAARTTTLEVTIPVLGLKSGDGALDDNMYKALKAPLHPTIRFSAKTSRVRVTGSAVEAVAEGRLSVAGVERTTSVVATGTVKGNAWHLVGSRELKMSDFGVKPPELFGGLIKCGDNIVIHYDLLGKLAGE